MAFIQQSLVTKIDGELHLVGGRRISDGRVVFPMPQEETGFEPLPLSREGRLWTWTVQRFLPKPPYLGAADSDAFRPFAVGYIELPEVIVEGWLNVDDFDSLEIGMPMRLATRDFARDATGEAISIYAFEPIEDVA